MTFTLTSIEVNIRNDAKIDEICYGNLNLEICFDRGGSAKRGRN